MAKTSKTYQDFDPNAYLKTDDYERDIKELAERIQKIEGKFGSHELIADTLCETEEKAAKMQSLFASSMVKQLHGNPDVQKALKEQVDKVDRNAVSSLVKKLGWAIWTVIVAIISGAVVFFVKQ